MRDDYRARASVNRATIWCMANYHPNAALLARALTRRWGELGRKQLEVADLADIGAMTVSRYAKGRIPLNPSPAVLRALDRASDWAEGTSLGLLNQEVTPGEESKIDTARQSDMLRRHLAGVGEMMNGFRELVAERDPEGAQVLDAWQSANEAYIYMLENEKPR